ncbi:MAG: glycosyltransferase [Acidobacteria bacterium]|nr:glycosyltransferase [Acidobacteriota bacterium]
MYRRLAAHHQIDVHLVVPVRDLRRWVSTDGAAGIDPLHAMYLETYGPHTRLQRVRGLGDVIRRVRPTHILVDAEAATLLVRDVTGVARETGARVCVLTTENRPRRFMREGLAAIVRGRPALGVGGVLAWWLLRSARRSLDHVFTICEDGTQVMSALGFDGRVTQMPLGFDPDLFYPQSPERIAATRARLALHSPTVAYFGRLVREKGVDLLLRALADLRDLRWQFLIDRFVEYRTPYQREIEQLIDTLGLTDRVVYFDAAHRDIPDYMNAADIVVLPSITTPTFKEQYGRVLPEAMACGTIVVGSSSGALPELIGDAGFVFPEGDVAALTGLLRKLLASRAGELAPMREHAASRARAELSIVRQAAILAGHLAA